MYTLILAGGKGTRLWPLSRELMPKQFIRFFNGNSLFQMTVRRALLLSSPDEIYVVANREYKFRVLDDLSDIGVKVPEDNVLLEPRGRNTLPAIYWGVKTVNERKGKSKILVLPSDHYIDPNENYVRAVREGEGIADEYIVTFGVKPTRPHTGYGYIKPGEKLKSGFRVDEFREKPDEERAKIYLSQGYLWNSGMFLLDTDLFMEEVKRVIPSVAEAFSSSDLEGAYESVPDISIDKGLMERTDKAAVIPLDVSWSDLGGFNSLYEILGKDEMGNAFRVNSNGSYIQLRSSGNLVITERLTAIVGVSNLVIVDTGDALLVADRKEDQGVREVYEELVRRGDERALIHRTVYRPWGSYTVLENGDRYRVKRITLLPGRRLSLQRHYNRSEHWVVVRGTAKIIIDGEERVLRPGESTFIPMGSVHRLENPGKIDLEVIEVQIGDYLGEDDIERLEDDYKR
ncbi:mannose-1-phosphate guanylyltransferase/mannose-6-phosphate isomerase [Candidatus Korarchaeum cryptofilum]|jgi:mannose-1-phosphate guanylyltransferase/mannose-6-phosphate isomerase|uniref:mannose-1-phosphate guanylyltransferase n=1 Tax=Candidatus Korarchaeum cryptofilum TaxID=498846 RepID=A0A429G274_9CREN|nr:mannose-1-phosphate guanylyltransferase/mannose-6-phosphate isomerase [Candidatus Korarchaeum cryptofilum]RSN67920.1 mannose-1-phosphate guanylyltransferase/mannose-6-phosphate isomerase [Candidatus Korarchaeum cryptofilum]